MARFVQRDELSDADTTTFAKRVSSDSALFNRARLTDTLARHLVKSLPNEVKDLSSEIEGISDAETEHDNERCSGDLLCYRHISNDEAVASTTEILAARANTRRVTRDLARFCSSMREDTQLLSRPARVLCVARRHNRKNKYVDFVGEYHLDLIQDNGGVAVIVPRTTNTFACLLEYLPMDGLLVVEGNDISDDVLRKYKCVLPNRLNEDEATRFASDTEFDTSKDELECALMNYALQTGCPILGLCRGSQMLNALRGGTIIGDIGTEVGTEIEHLKDSSDPEYDSHRHPIHVEGGTPLSSMFSATIDTIRGGDLLVNSYHHQASGQLGRGLAAMAHSPDGVIEAFYDTSYNPEAGNFVVGLQFHPERMMEDYPSCKEVYAKFLQASNAFRRREEAR